jgi:acyl-coenzyme A thioesterase PaaI-like protein
MRKHERMTTEIPSGRDVIAQFIPQSPFVAKLGIVADQLGDDEVRLRLPWDPSNVTVGDMVHGGAIATLADLTVMAAAWCGAEAPPELRGVTVSMALAGRWVAERRARSARG